jgi:hypothetical protein
MVLGRNRAGPSPALGRALSLCDQGCMYEGARVFFKMVGARIKPVVIYVNPYDHNQMYGWSGWPFGPF